MNKLRVHCDSFTPEISKAIEDIVIAQKVDAIVIDKDGHTLEVKYEKVQELLRAEITYEAQSKTEKLEERLEGNQGSTHAGEPTL